MTNPFTQAGEVARSVYLDTFEDFHRRTNGSAQAADQLDRDSDEIAELLAAKLGKREMGDVALIVGSAIARVGTLPGEVMSAPEVVAFALSTAGALIAQAELNRGNAQVAACFANQKKGHEIPGAPRRCTRAAAVGRGRE